MSAHTPAAFISYSREDSEFALRLAEDLKAAGARVWLDQLDIEPGRAWDSAIEEALVQAPRMLLILSPSSAKSNNVRNEISFALDEQKIIIPIMHQNCVVPLQLHRIQRVDFRLDYARGIAALMRLLVAPPGQLEALDAERKAQENTERKAQENTERKAREEAERRVRVEAESKAREAAERKAKEDESARVNAAAELENRAVAQRRALTDTNEERAATPIFTYPEKPSRTRILIGAGIAGAIVSLALASYLVYSSGTNQVQPGLAHQTQPGPIVASTLSVASGATDVKSNSPDSKIDKARASQNPASPIPPSPKQSSPKQYVPKPASPKQYSPEPYSPKQDAIPPMQAVAPSVFPKGPARVDSGIIAGLIIDRPPPVYPPIAKADHVQGTVVLHAIISKQGTIENLQVISGPPMLTASAMDAVKRWRYKPFLLKGEPTEVDTTINVNFKFGGS